MKTMIPILLILLFFTGGLHSSSAQSESDTGIKSNQNLTTFPEIVIKVMNRGTNVLMSSSFIFILIYSLYIAISVGFGSKNASEFVPIFWGSGIVFAGGAIAKIYYLFLT